MPLPSQTGRSTGAARYSTRRRKGLGSKLVVAGVIAGAAVAIWFLLPSKDRDRLVQPKEASADSGSSAATPDRSVTPEVVLSPTPEPTPPPAPLVEITQGRGGAGRSSPADTTPTTPASNTPSPVAPPTEVRNPSPSPSSPGLIDTVPSVAAARQKQAEGDLSAARILLSRVLADGKLNAPEEAALRDELSKLNDELVFSPRVIAGDPYTMLYKVQSGDSLVRIAQRNKLGPDWRLIQRVNRMSNPNRLSEGQALKLVRGPFHAVVRKSKYRLDLYMGPADDESNWVFVRSFTVGLGEGNSTPTGTFVVKKGSKLVDPYWVNPRTGERFESSDPKNPIGEFWIGLEGLGDAVTVAGYGIHGTIDPDSIGKQKSMGCVRLGNEDIALMYELLGEQVSMVRIEP